MARISRKRLDIAVLTLNRVARTSRKLGEPDNYHIKRVGANVQLQQTRPDGRASWRFGEPANISSTYEYLHAFIDGVQAQQRQHRKD